MRLRTTLLDRFEGIFEKEIDIKSLDDEEKEIYEQELKKENNGFGTRWGWEGFVLEFSANNPIIREAWMNENIQVFLTQVLYNIDKAKNIEQETKKQNNK